ncbi:unnamed protein product [Clonostachys rosea]|uniref:Mid2 domain-containing protein n=1 Tax=Bionectria ochroleuca TaxID=29856 RepID=A0ABY6UVP2_BIOOC|nr:unnamed protein product [Clonostachys rosea]
MPGEGGRDLPSTPVSSTITGGDAVTNLFRPECLTGSPQHANAVNRYANDDTTSGSWDGPVLTKPVTSTSWRGPSRSSPSTGHGASSISISTSQRGAPSLSKITSGQKQRTSSSDEWRGPGPSSPSRATSTGSHSQAQHTSSPSTSSPNPAEETESPTATGGDPAETGVQSGTSDQQDRLSNGATAGIVIAAMAVLLGIIYLCRYLYKKRRREKRRGWHDDSSGIGPYHSDSRHDPPPPPPAPPQQLASSPPPVEEQGTEELVRVSVSGGSSAGECGAPLLHETGTSEAV